MQARLSGAAYVYRDYWSNVYHYGKDKHTEDRLLDRRFDRTSSVFHLYLLNLFAWSIVFVVIVSFNFLLKDLYFNLTMAITITCGLSLFLMSLTLTLPLLFRTFFRTESRLEPEIVWSIREEDYCDVKYSDKIIASHLVDPKRLVERYMPIEVEATEDSIGFFQFIESMPEKIRRDASRRYLIKLATFMILALVAIWFLMFFQYRPSNVWQAALSLLIFLRAISMLPKLYNSKMEASLANLSLGIPRFRKYYYVLLNLFSGTFTLVFLISLYGVLYSVLQFIFSQPLVFTVNWDNVSIWAPEAVAWAQANVLPKLIELLAILLLLAALGFLYYLFEARHQFSIFNLFFYSDKPESESHPYITREDRPFWVSGEYWVLRFNYFWGYEVAFPPHEDWERIECWCNARTGRLEWVVFDYHYRELWCRIDQEMPQLYVIFDGNFHSPLPLISREQQNALETAFLRTKGKISSRQSTILRNETPLAAKAHSYAQLRPFFSNGISGDIAAKACAKIPWNYWRYSNGSDRDEFYRLKKVGASLNQIEMRK